MVLHYNGDYIPELQLQLSKTHKFENLKLKYHGRIANPKNTK